MNNNLKSSAALTNLSFIFLILIALACKCGLDNKGNQNISRDKNNRMTTVILVRHAEKADEPKDNPGLTEEGVERANLLKEMLAGKGVKAIYTSKYRRTKETAKPLADELGITPIEINEAEPIAQSILKNNQGQTVLVVGHTNTIPKIIENLGGEEIDTIPETEFDNMFTVTIPAAGSVNVVKAKY